MHTRQRGRWGERIARTFLEARGYRILAQNVTFREGEIDLVARDGTETVFLEVKLRTSGSFGLPEDAVDARKARRLAAAVSRYCDRYAVTGPVRCDVVAISVDGRAGRAIVRLLRNVELPAPEG